MHDNNVSVNCTTGTVDISLGHGLRIHKSSTENFSPPHFNNII